MKLITTEKRLNLLSKSILKKANKDKDALHDIHASIKEEIIALINEWHIVSKPNNVITSETKELLTKLEDVIYLTFKDE